MLFFRRCRCLHRSARRRWLEALAALLRPPTVFDGLLLQGRRRFGVPLRKVKPVVDQRDAKVHDEDHTPLKSIARFDALVPQPLTLLSILWRARAEFTLRVALMAQAKSAVTVLVATWPAPPSGAIPTMSAPLQPKHAAHCL